LNILIAGGSGAIGRQLVPMLAQQGHRVVARTRPPVIGDVFGADPLAETLRVRTEGTRNLAAARPCP